MLPVAGSLLCSNALRVPVLTPLLHAQRHLKERSCRGYSHSQCRLGRLMFRLTSILPPLSLSGSSTYSSFTLQGTSTEAFAGTGAPTLAAPPMVTPAPMASITPRGAVGLPSGWRGRAPDAGLPNWREGVGVPILALPLSVRTRQRSPLGKHLLYGGERGGLNVDMRASGLPRDPSLAPPAGTRHLPPSPS